MLSAIEEDRIEAAVNAAEAGTSAEIVCVLAAEVSNYREVPLAWAAAASLVVPPLALALGAQPLGLAAQAGVWFAAQTRAMDGEFALAFAIYAVLQALLFIVVFAVAEIPAVRRALTPAVLKRHRVARVAHQQFTAIGARAAAGAGGVLIFVALDDRQVRILASDAAHEKVGEPVWARAVKAIADAMKAGHDPTSGIVEAVSICGTALAQHYPADAAHPHALSNRPLEI